MMTSRVMRSVGLLGLSSKSGLRAFSSKSAKDLWSIGGLRASQLENGITVVSASSSDDKTNLFPYVALHVNVGTRDETSCLQGAAHIVKQMAFKSTQDHTALAFFRNIEFLGGKFNVTHSREELVYTAEFGKNVSEQAVNILSEFTRPRLIHWELKDHKPIIAEEIALKEQCAKNLLIEGIHREAFRSKGLGNPRYCPTYNLGKLTKTGDEVRNHLKQHFVGSKMTLVGTGLEHERLLQLAQKSFSNVPSTSTSIRENSKYIGGELRVASGADSHLALVFEGVNADDKDRIVVDTLEALLGGACALTKQGVGRAQSRLAQIVAKNESWVLKATSYRASYSDSGLFGVCALAKPGHLNKLAGLLASELNGITKSVTEEEVQRARQTAKASFLRKLETKSGNTDYAFSLAKASNKTDPISFSSHFDQVSASDIKRVAKRLLSSELTLVSVGRDIDLLPTRQELKSVISA